LLQALVSIKISTIRQFFIFTIILSIRSLTIQQFSASLSFILLLYYGWGCSLMTSTTKLQFLFPPFNPFFKVLWIFKFLIIRHHKWMTPIGYTEISESLNVKAKSAMKIHSHRIRESVNWLKILTSIWFLVRISNFLSWFFESTANTDTIKIYTNFEAI